MKSCLGLWETLLASIFLYIHWLYTRKPLCPLTDVICDVISIMILCHYANTVWVETLWPCGSQHAEWTLCLRAELQKVKNLSATDTPQGVKLVLKSVHVKHVTKVVFFFLGPMLLSHSQCACKLLLLVMVFIKCLVFILGSSDKVSACACSRLLDCWKLKL